MNRIVAALLLVFWTASVGRCLAEQYGLLHDKPALECCAHEHEPEDSHGDGDHDVPEPARPPGVPCGICHMLELSGVSLTKPVLVDQVSLLPVMQVTLPELNLMPVVELGGLAENWLRPPIRRLSWGAFLIQTSLPVRGPDMAC